MMPLRPPTKRASRAMAALTLLLVAASLVACNSVRAETGDDIRLCDRPATEIFEKLSPAVVFIAATSINPYRLADRVIHVVGSGVIVDPAGLVVTNSHVVFGRQSITVTLDDGTTVPAELAGADPVFDLAVVRITRPDGANLPAAVLGDSDLLRVGEEVLAIGNPLGLDQTLTRGVVSGMNRILPDTPLALYEPLIQTDAAINPGNSGGPLVNRCGQVVGINTAIIPEAQSIGFAIPSNLVRTMLPVLLADGRMIRPWVGFHGTFVEDSLREVLRMPIVEGLLIEVIEPGSPAEQAGLHGGRVEFSLGGKSLLLGGDIITSANGIRMASTDSLRDLMQTLRVGQTLRLTVFRKGEYRQVEYVLPERPLLPSDVTDGRALVPMLRLPR